MVGPLNDELCRFAELRRRITEADPDIRRKKLFDTLEGATNLHEAILAVIRSALDDEALAKALRARIEDMRQRLGRIESAAEAKREAALNAEERADMIKLTAPDFTTSIPNQSAIPSHHLRSRNSGRLLGPPAA